MPFLYLRISKPLWHIEVQGPMMLSLNLLLRRKSKTFLEPLNLNAISLCLGSLLRNMPFQLGISTNIENINNIHIQFYGPEMSLQLGISMKIRNSFQTFEFQNWYFDAIQNFFDTSEFQPTFSTFSYEIPKCALFPLVFQGKSEIFLKSLNITAVSNY